MDQDESPDTTQPENMTDETPEEPTAAHFREAARLAAARVRAALAQNPIEPESTPETEQPDPQTFEEEARKHARALGGQDPEQDAPEAKADKPSGKQPSGAMLSKIDERLELGARMLRAFESQIQRLERSARTAEDAHAALEDIPNPTKMEAVVNSLEQRVNTSMEQAEGAARKLEETTSSSNATAEALATGLETANTVKALLDTTLTSLAEEADARSAEVKKTLAEAEHAVKMMEAQLKRAEEIEHAVSARLTRAQQAADQINQSSNVALDSIREHIAVELNSIGSALLNAPATTPNTTPAPTPTPTPPPSEQPTTSTTPVEEPPLIEVESMEEKRTTPPQPMEAPPLEDAGTGISRGTLSLDEDAIRRHGHGD